jgi:hypothetical protein
VPRPALARTSVTVAVTVAVAVAVATALVGCGEDEPTAGEARADQVRSAAEEAGLPGEVVDVLATAAAAVDATYRVAYELEDRTVTVVQRPPDRRVDVVADDGTADATISVEGTAYACTDPPGDADPWRCEVLGDPAAEGVFGDDDVTGLAEALAAGAEDYEFTTETREVAGTEATCVVTRLLPGADADASLGHEGVLCVADTGAVLLAERPSGTLRASVYGTDVADDAFELPAFPPAD